MRKPRICIYGGTGLDAPAPAFVTELACAILDGSPSVIVTGGFLHFRNEPHKISTDHAALDGALRHARAAGVDLRDCFEAWLPEPELDRKREKGGVVRMSAAEHGITIRMMRQKSPLGRRLSMVHDVDVIVTIGGKRHTNEVLEQALELNVPALPLRFADGDSKDFWELYCDWVVRSFSLDAHEVTFLDGLTAQDVARDVTQTARQVAALVARARIGRCLVLMPFGSAHDALFDNVIMPAVDSVMICDRLDRRAGSGAIRDNFVDAVERACAVIADVTNVNANVMYEIGYAIAKGLQPLFYCQSGIAVDALPVYLRDLNIAVAPSSDVLAERIGAHLRDVLSSERRAKPGP